MEIRELQENAYKAIIEMLEKKGIEADADLILIHLIEELGELYRQRMNEKLERDVLDKKNLGDEISDCIILLMGLSKQYNLDIEDYLKDKIEDIRTK